MDLYEPPYMFTEEKINLTFYENAYVTNSNTIHCIFMYNSFHLVIIHALCIHHGVLSQMRLTYTSA
jgi:hypothetical protein